MRQEDERTRVDDRALSSISDESCSWNCSLHCLAHHSTHTLHREGENPAHSPPPWPQHTTGESSKE